MIRKLSLRSMRLGILIVLTLLVAFAGDAQQPPCPENLPLINTSNVFLGWVGQTRDCTPGGRCVLNEIVNFEARRFGTSFDCVTEFAWSFGDGITASTTVPSITHTYTQPGSYVVSVTIKRPDVHLTLTRNLVVAADIPTLSTTMLWIMAGLILTIGVIRTR